MTWFVMRDLTRANASRPAWKELTDAGLRVFTPMVWKIRKRGVRTERYKAPAIHDLLFVDSTRAELDPEVARRATLQYRFVRGGAHGEAMTVNDSEITPSMIGKQVLIVGGPLDGMTGHLLSVKGMRTKRLIVELPGMLTSAVEVAPDFIRFI